MKLILALLALSCPLAATLAAEPAARPNQPVFKSGPWIVVRSVREHGNVVGCTGFYRLNRHVQLSKDMLAIQTPEAVQTVALGFDGGPTGAARELTKPEKELKAIAITGEDFERLARSHSLRIDVRTAKGPMSHEVRLTGLSAALQNIREGCPVADRPLLRKPG